MGSSEKRTRGPNKQKPWVRDPAAGASVLRLAVDTSDPVQRSRIEAMFEGAYAIYRAVQADGRHRSRAYWAATHERKRDPAATRARLGLSQDDFEEAASGHVARAPHLRRFVTKALAMHLADAAWTAFERHLFRDARGNRHGMPRVGAWYEFTRLPGRARSHTTERKWETFRIVGTLAGHRATYTDARGDFVQPRRMRPVASKAWWNYEGPLAIVFTGLAEGSLVLPVRLPTAPCNQPILDHHLSSNRAWHKVDLVRTRDPGAVGGWRYEAHLMVLTQPYVSPSTAARRERAAIEVVDRVAGIDVNVSNITVASHEAGGELRITRIERDATQKARERKQTRRDRQRKRALERSRRAMNRDQYQLSKRQEKRARRRASAGLRAVQVVPRGPRIANTAGKPVQRYRNDTLSASYRRTRAAQAADAAATTQARRARARQTAAELVATHGYRPIVEATSIAAWSRSWGRAVAAFSPGALVAAIDREAKAVAKCAGGTGGVERASTRTTALSQHCPCGARVQKSLGDRVHRCPACDLVGDRDAVSAVLASFVVFGTRGDPASAEVDYLAAMTALPAIRRALRTSYSGWQDTLSESTDLSARERLFLAWPTSTPDPVAVARRTVGMAPYPILDEPGTHQTTSARAWMRTNMFGKRSLCWPHLRDTS